MRIILLLLMIAFMANTGLSQQPVKEIKKPIPDQVPSKNQMQNQLVEAINEINTQIADLENQLAEAIKNKEDEETIKDLRDQIAMLKKQAEMMGGVTQRISNISDAKIQKALYDDNYTSVPKKDFVRIKMLPDGVLTDAELIPFVKKVHSEIETLLNAKDKAEAIELYTALKSKKINSDDISHVANTLWISGQTRMALFILGKECSANMENLNNLNNYAAFLTMQGAQHAALPILQNLNRKIPNNTTLLNNIGQAWYGLGDMNNATQYLDKAMGIYKNHPHANETKSKIQKSEGKTQESIESLKRSIEENYTTEKEAQLNELGYQVKFEDVKFKYPMKAEPLGIEQFMFSIPEYPFQGGVTAETSRKEWDDFRNKINSKIDALEKIKEVQKAKADAYHKRFFANPLLLRPYNTNVYKTARRKLDLLAQWGQDRLLTLTEESRSDHQIVSQLRESYYKALKNTEDCGARLGLATAFLSQANQIVKDNNAKILSLLKQVINAGSNYALYACTDRSEYELELTGMKISFLLNLRSFSPEIEVGCIKTEAPEGRRGPLPDFDEVNCQYKTELAVPYLERFYSIKVECNKMTTTFDAKFVKGRFEENLANGKYKGTLEIEGKIGSDKISVGPVEMGTSVKAGAGVDFTESGIQDVYITGEAQVKAGVATVSSVEAKVSVISGNTSLSGKGAFSGVNIRF
jgi:Tfp pilus assembly protein PilF